MVNKHIKEGLTLYCTFPTLWEFEELSHLLFVQNPMFSKAVKYLRKGKITSQEKNLKGKRNFYNIMAVIIYHFLNMFIKCHCFNNLELNLAGKC